MTNLLKNKNIFPILSLLVAAVIGTIAANQFLFMRKEQPLHPSPALSKIEKLSVYNPNLTGTHGDTDVYFFDSGNPGGTVLILGGTHPNEPAGFMTAYLFLENCELSAGRLLIIPRANASAFTHNDPMEGQPQFITIDGKNGKRQFRFGSRITNPIDQWPDPEIYLHYPSGQKLAGNETRNLNRSYPGKPNGSLTVRVAYAIVNLINTEHVDVAFDLHEAAPEYPVVNAIVASERSQDIASEAAMMLEFEGIRYSLEPSPYNFHGLSHREWQDETRTFPILLETANPVQGRLRGRSDEALIITGKDKMYLRAAALGELHVPFDENGIPLEMRVARHVAAVQKIIATFSEYHPESAIEVNGIPAYEEFLENGLQNYF
ncbi:MAG: succinylglutamate desuccinylase/aspartoacylase family protein [Deferribacteres bacterium]|nr:succinylglutamate desuccinylase/aspartoacylase family protein [candidate division KSB1 bacterium]MCB9504156.1 succinylglutamate desuccinylase/aspartoacylase family protein [Deferribacteres bacterium]